MKRNISTIVERLIHHSSCQPNARAFTFLKDGKIESEFLTYLELDQKARAIAAELQSAGARGERALLVYPPGLDFIAAFLGCLYSGTIAIPVPAPDAPRLKRMLPRLCNISDDAQASFLLTTYQMQSQLEATWSEVVDLEQPYWVTTDLTDCTGADNWKEYWPEQHDIAYLQYTSGSTSDPKGVIISHENLIHNSASLSRAWELTSGCSTVNWLPHFHDYGLVAGLVMPMYAGVPCYVMSPLAFLKQPLRWLQTISQYRVTHSQASNFAYDYCVRKITAKQQETLDLSSWRVAHNGAEPIRPQTLKQFSRTFATCGLRPSTLRTAYGLAEATLVVTTKRGIEPTLLYSVQASTLEHHQIAVDASSDSEDVRTLVGCGQPLDGLKVVIANPETLVQCPANCVGEIWVSGTSVAQGYWNRPEETAKTFQAYLKDTGEGPFLRTGDLGLIKDGEIIIIGRLKDLLIIGGVNHYPQDIEWTVEESHPSIRPHYCAAFSVDVGGEEQLVVMAETQHQPDSIEEVVNAIRRAIAESHGLEVYSIALTKKGMILKTSSGKIARKACRKLYLDGNLQTVGLWKKGQECTVQTQYEEKSAISKKTSTDLRSLDLSTVQAWLTDKLAQRCQIATKAVDPYESFAYYGLSSIEMVSLIGDLEERLGQELSPTLAYNYSSIFTLTQYLTGGSVNDRMRFQPMVASQTTLEPIAIVGMSCRFPGAENLDAFWELLQRGGDAITEIPPSRWNADEFYDSKITLGKMNCRWGGFLQTADTFDSQFFGISAREAATMDPQQRWLLEVSWEALENAGLPPKQLAGTRTGVFVGIASNDYSYIQFGNDTRINPYTGTGSSHSIAANRLSYLLDLHGPSLAIDTACSSSLVALHIACQSLRSGDCDLAIVGSANAILTPQLTIALSQAQMMAADGRCKTFDTSADGYVRGEGCGVIVLKRLSKAKRDKNPILALIRGSAINENGRSNGLTAPNGLAQQAVIRQALEMAGVAPAQISYVETHGTGTKLGDPVEVEALKAVLQKERTLEQPCIIGSVKTNIGHLEAAAGIAGLIKTVLALRYEQIPPHLHLNTINPLINFDKTAFSIATQSQQWPTGTQPRFAGVSSFGFGGTNAHVILEEAPPYPDPESSVLERPLHLLALSAKTPQALQQLAARFTYYLEQFPDVSLSDLCFSVNAGRNHFAHRLAVTTASLNQLRQELSAFANNQSAGNCVYGQVDSAQRPKIAFLFTGQGSQYVGMSLQLYQTQPIFKQALDECDRLLCSELEQSLLTVLYDEAVAEKYLNRPTYAQPALFAIQYALVQLWRAWGVEPELLASHSIGEYAAACISGVFSLAYGLKLIAARGRLMEQLATEGIMVAVQAEYEQVATAIKPYEGQVAIAAVNAPRQIVISGEPNAVNAILKELMACGVHTHQINTSLAFHSPLIEPVLDAFEREAQKVNYLPPERCLISSMTGKVVTGYSASYWRDHTREPVQFATVIETLQQAEVTAVIEIGPKPTLLSLCRQCLPESNIAWLPSLQPGKPDWKTLLTSLEQLYVQGTSIDWVGFDREYQRKWLQLPTYPFERKRHWLDNSEVDHQSLAVTTDTLWKALTTAGHQQSDRGILEFSIPAAPEQVECMTKLCTTYLNLAIQQLGAFQNQDESYTVAEFIQHFGVPSYFQVWLSRWLNILAQRGQLQQQGETYMAFNPCPANAVEELIKEVRMQWEGSTQMVDILEQCGNRLANVLSGRENIRDLLFPNGSLTLMENLYEHSALTSYYNAIVRELLRAIVQNTLHKTRLRILEIGAGTGATCSWIMPILSSQRTSYTLTDVSMPFLKHAASKFQQYSFLEYKLLDIEQSPESQGYSSHSYDVIIAANVLHATRNIAEILRHIRTLLAPSGVLVFWEITEPQVWFDVAFGALVQPLDDQGLRPEHPFLTEKQWSQALREQGFDDIAYFPASDCEAKGLGQHVITAKAPATDLPSVKTAFSEPVVIQEVIEGASKPISQQVALVDHTSVSTSVHPFLGYRLRSALQTVQFEAQLSQPNSPLLDGCQVYGKTIVSEAIYIDMAIAAANTVLSEEAKYLEKVAFQKPLLLPARESKIVQTVLEPQEEGRFVLKILSFESGGEEESLDQWIPHFTGQLSNLPRSTVQPSSLIVENIRARCKEVLSGDENYQHYQEHGIRYAKHLRGLEQIWRRDGEALGFVRLPSTANIASHSVLLEGGLQVAEACLPHKVRTIVPGSVFVPAAIERLEIYSNVPKQIWSHATVRSIEGTGLLTTITVDLILANEQGQVFMQIQGLHLHPNRIRRHPLVNQLQAIRLNDRPSFLVDHICNQVTDILGFDSPSTINLQQGWFEMGIDSLTAVELKARLESSLGQVLPTTLVFDHPTVTTLTDYLLQKIFPTSLDESSSPLDLQKRHESSLKVTEGELDLLSEEDLAALLEQELSDTGNPS